MILEYILLLTAFVVLLFKVIYTAPADAFSKAGPKLGARVEKHMVTGKGFSDEGVMPTQWKEKPF